MIQLYSFFIGLAVGCAAMSVMGIIAGLLDEREYARDCAKFEERKRYGK